MRGHGADVARASSIPGPVGITDRGVILGRSVLVRTAAGASRPIALDTDRDRLFALLSVVAERLVGAEVLRPIEAAAAHWQRGDRALANLRLVFSGLPRLADPAAAARLSLAEQVLDGGMTPAALMKALWPQPDPNALDKYNPDQPRVPAGNGIESGRWELGDDGQESERTRPDEAFRVAETDNKPPGGDDIDHAGLGPDGRHIGSADGSTSVREIDPLLDLPGGVRPGADMSIGISLARFGEAAQHVLDAQTAGQPSILTIARSAAGSNRAAATGGLPKVPNMHLDEYPPAMFVEGGNGASVRPISPRDNKALGAYIGQRCRTLPNGSKVEIKVYP